MVKILNGVFQLLHFKQKVHTMPMEKEHLSGMFSPCRKGKIYQNHHAKVSCDFYNRYVHDLILMQSLGIPNYRFSLSWSRIIPQGVGKVNCKGIEFYNRVIDFCFELGIEPWITLYHWDLPQALQQKGGWTNRDIINWFSDYVSLCIQQFGRSCKVLDDIK